MIRYLNASNFEDIENFLLRKPDDEYNTSRFTYFFRQVGDCAGIFRRARYSEKKRGAVKDKTELVAYYHEGEF